MLALQMHLEVALAFRLVGTLRTGELGVLAALVALVTDEVIPVFVHSLALQTLVLRQ